MKKQYDLEPVWDSVLNIYDVFCEICNKHNLRHYAYWGTLLGAVRHHGFIPWDDDLDVIMPRDDYEKLIEIAPLELPSDLVFHSKKTQPGYIGVFNKIKSTNEALVNEIRKKSNLTLIDGLNIDIFPLDGAPSGKISEKIYWAKRRTLRSVGLVVELFNTQKFSVKYLPLYFLGGVFFPLYSNIKSSDEMNDEIEKWAMSYQFSEDRCSVYCQGDVARFLPPGCFEKTIMMDFSLGRKVPVPGGYKEILTRLYGDYMKLPPVEQRHPKHQGF